MAHKKNHKSKKVKKVMKEFAEGKLKSSSGKKVTNKEQALAIGYSEARRNNKKKKNNTKGARDKKVRKAHAKKRKK